MVSVLLKKFFRDIRDHWPQFTAITLVILCGIAALVTSRGAANSLKASRDSYYADYAMADFWVYMKKAPESAIEKLRALPGVGKARGRIIFDVPVTLPGVDDAITGRVISTPVPSGASGISPPTGLIDIKMVKGRFFTKPREPQVIVNLSFANARNLEPGSVLKAVLNEKEISFKVVGVAQSPEYIYTIRGISDFLPNPKTFAILWVPREFAEQACDFQGASNNVIGTIAGSASVDEILDKAEKIFKPFGCTWSVKLDDQISNRMVTDEAEGQEGSANITPTVFLVVAAMVLAIMLSRMVRNQRTEVGVLMAMGYRRTTIIFYYTAFSLAIGLAGSAGGLAAGYVLAREITQLYREFYSFPELVIRIPPGVILESIASGLLFSLAGGLIAVRGLLGITPAAAMRPEPPSMGKRTIIERVSIIWKKLPFRWKMVSRNMARHKVRASFAVGGIAVSASILVLGFFSLDSMNFLMSFQYTRIQQEDMLISLAGEKDAAVSREVGGLPGVKRSEPMLQVPVEITCAWRKKFVAITGLERDGKLRQVYDASGRRLEIPEEGLLMGKRLAERLGVSEGDSVLVKPLIGNKKEKRVRVSRLAEGYFGLLAYMELGALSRLVGERKIANAALAEVEHGKMRGLEKTLRETPTVTAAEPKERQHQNFKDTLESSMNIMTTVMLIFAGVIAFSVVFTMTTVSIIERERELASLRVIGLAVDEVAAIVFNENFLLALAGIAIGLPLGLLECHALMDLYATDLYRFPVVITPKSYFVTAVAVFLFVMFSNWISYRKIQKLNMVEVLKTRE